MLTQELLQVTFSSLLSFTMESNQTGRRLARCRGLVTGVRTGEETEEGIRFLSCLYTAFAFGAPRML